MRIDTAFELGQVVYGIANAAEETWVSCTFCAATGRVAGADDESSACPVCYGQRGATKWLPTQWRPQGPLTIGQVRVEITQSAGVDGEEMFDNFMPQAGRSEEYMAVETGVGSGRIWKAEFLFATFEESKAACAERNAAVAA